MPIRYPAWGAEPLEGTRWAMLLYGFKIASEKLQAEHIDVMNQFALSLRAASKTRSFVIAAKGHASRSGSAAYNLALSTQRANEVTKYLSPLVAGFASVIPVGYGEAAAEIDGLPDGIESERHRSVVLIAVEYKKGGPPSVKLPKLPKLRVTRLPKLNLRRLGTLGRYSVQMLSGHEGSASIPLPLGFGVGGQITRFKLRIRDKSRGQYGDFVLWTAQQKFDWGPPGSLEQMGKGSEVFFTMDPDVRVWDLPGFVRVSGASADFFSEGVGFGHVMTDRELEPSGRTVWIRFPIPRGSQEWEFGKVGAGLSSGRGYLEIDD